MKVHSLQNVNFRRFELLELKSRGHVLPVSEPDIEINRALKAEIDESAWATLYSTVSRPFEPPETGKIAIKVINHYGDEVLKVYEVG